jgi:serpin B
VQSLDFAQAEAARETINRWVEQQTNAKIKNLIPPKSLNARTRLVLTNAVYFLGNWVAPFDKLKTQDDDFTVSAQERVKVPLMHPKTTMGYAEDDMLQALARPYIGRELSMVVLLPRKADGLPELEIDHTRRSSQVRTLFCIFGTSSNRPRVPP